MLGILYFLLGMFAALAGVGLGASIVTNKKDEK